jgi:hypothetical protein
MSSNEDKCTVCGQSEEWHLAHKPRHRYSPLGGIDGPASLNKKQKETKVQQGMSADPALRLALVNAGVIGYAEILAAEEQLRSAARGGESVVIPIDSHPSRGSSSSEFPGSG